MSRRTSQFNKTDLYKEYLILVINENNSAFYIDKLLKKIIYSYTKIIILKKLGFHNSTAQLEMLAFISTMMAVFLVPNREHHFEI